MVEIDMLHFHPFLKKKEKWGFESTDRKITAWAELPKPYQQEPKEE